ncbi:MAG: SusE domain-containing protein [Chitinophagaceae bacterium]|jgi:hypothetical protein|nr:SusE domain-containing protein [Chitinophagaceae bacterium]
MKKLTIISALAAIVVLGWGCEKDENKVFYEDGTAPVLTISTTSPALTPGAAFDRDPAINFNWTNPNYKLTTGRSSHDVNYRLEIDTVGANFGSRSKGIVAVSRDLNRNYTVGEFNALLSGANFMNLPADRTYNFEARVISSIGLSGGMALTSNVVRFTARPFSPPPAVAPPTANTLWATGNAFASGWSNPLGAPFDGQQRFTRVTNTLYELTVDMPGGGNYKLIQEQGNWGTQFHMIDGGTWEAGQFRQRDAEPGFIGPPTAGKYKITVNFQSGRFNVVKQ